MSPTAGIVALLVTGVLVVVVVILLRRVRRRRQAVRRVQEGALALRRGEAAAAQAIARSVGDALRVDAEAITVVLRGAAVRVGVRDSAREHTRQTALSQLEAEVRRGLPSGWIRFELDLVPRRSA